MPISLNDNLRVLINRPIDSKWGPYTGLDHVASSILLSERYQGLTVGISGGGKVSEYWYRDDINNLVLKEIDLSNNLNNLVYTTGDQTISGKKIFIDDTRISGSLNVGSGVPTTLFVSGKRVGVNTESPEDHVHVEGTGYFSSGLLAGPKASGVTLYVTSQRVGINTENPQAALDVSGSVKFNERPTVNGTGVLLSGEMPGLGLVGGVRVAGIGNTDFLNGFYEENGTLNDKPKYTKDDFTISWKFGIWIFEGMHPLFPGNPISIHGNNSDNPWDVPSDEWLLDESPQPSPNISNMVLEKASLVDGNLTVQGSANIGKILYASSGLLVGNISDPVILSVKSGNVGINIENPQAALDVSGSVKLNERPTVNGTGVLLSGDSLSSNLLSSIVYTTGNQNIQGEKTFISTIYSNSGLEIGSSSSASVLFVNSGRVGINNENPQASFHVSGNSIFSQRPLVNTTGVLLIGEAYPLNNPSGFITGVDLSHLYPRSNPSGFITGVGNINDLVYATGNQSVSGEKTFHNTLFGLSGAEFGPSNLAPTLFLKGQRVSINKGTDPQYNLDVSGSSSFTERPVVNGTGVLLQGDSLIGENLTLAVSPLVFNAGQLSIQQASSVNAGSMSSNDKNKLDSLNNVSSFGPIILSRFRGANFVNSNYNPNVENSNGNRRNNFYPFTPRGNTVLGFGLGDAFPYHFNPAVYFGTTAGNYTINAYVRVTDAIGDGLHCQVRRTIQGFGSQAWIDQSGPSFIPVGGVANPTGNLSDFGGGGILGEVVYFASQTVAITNHWMQFEFYFSAYGGSGPATNGANVQDCEILCFKN